MRISYSKLKAMCESVPSYRFSENGDLIEVLYYPPSLSYASGIDEDSENARESVIVIRGVRRGDFVEIEEAYVEGPWGRRRLTEDELQLWVMEVESMEP